MEGGRKEGRRKEGGGRRKEKEGRRKEELIIGLLQFPWPPEALGPLSWYVYTFLQTTLRAHL